MAVAVGDDEPEVVAPGELYRADANLQRWLDYDPPDALGPAVDEVSDSSDKDFDSGIFTRSEGTSNSWRPNLQGDVPNTGHNISQQPGFACHFYKKNPNKYFPTTRRYRTCPVRITELRRIKFVPYILWL